MVWQAELLGCVMPYWWFERAGSSGYSLRLDYPGVSPGWGRSNRQWLYIVFFVISLRSSRRWGMVDVFLRDLLGYSLFERAGSGGYSLRLGDPGVSPGLVRSNDVWLHVVFVGDILLTVASLSRV